MNPVVLTSIWALRRSSKRKLDIQNMYVFCKKFHISKSIALLSIQVGWKFSMFGYGFTAYIKPASLEKKINKLTTRKKYLQFCKQSFANVKSMNDLKYVPTTKALLKYLEYIKPIYRANDKKLLQKFNNDIYNVAKYWILN